MNKEELVTEVASKVGTTKKVAESVLDATLEAIINSVAEGQKVTLVGFGSFEARKRQAREGRNPGTGAPLHIPAKTVPTFSAGKLFREKVADSAAKNQQK
ncbi:MAG: HU family DNA-binding protein [Gloeomargarita sp. SKYG116]|nr:HU family DNA-binding protein [Gloeomargarita sp. SKYG116]MCS7226384.1 HU family DNA-binding protein [Gloeomargarita sp. SKYB31]MDW8400847.1 HU family DNA-binding protein [Gloeomargarita sp. SKYGB_i_bin116]